MRFVLNLFCLAVISLSTDYATCDTETRYCNEGLGVCTPFQSCSNATVFDDGSSHISVRFAVELETEACHYLEMCCDPEDVMKNSFEEVQNKNIDGEKPLNLENLDSTIEDRVKAGDENDFNCEAGDRECIPFHYCMHNATTDGADMISSRLSEGEELKCPLRAQVCCDKNENIVRFVPSVCGRHNPDGIGYNLIGSIDEANYGEIPWMAALSELNHSGDFDYFCGGSLIHPNVILTAAHCVHKRDPNLMRVRLGEWDSQTTNELLPHYDHDVDRIVVHEDFGTSNLFNDVALVILKIPAQLKVHVNTICLPPKRANFDHSQCFASGWGKDKFGSAGIYRVNMKKIEMPVVPLKDCQDKLRNTKLGPRFRIHTGFMCAGGEKDVDTCTGDGGSPLVCPIPGKKDFFYQAGLVAWGIECGQEGVPGVYANVARYRDWIDQHMNNFGYGTSSYILP